MPISTTRPGKSEWKFSDNSNILLNGELGQETFHAVQAAMWAGLAEFTTPTPQDDELSIHWKVRRWVFMRKGVLVCMLVAQQVLNEHFEICGPEVPLPPSPYASIAPPAPVVVAPGAVAGVPATATPVAPPSGKKG